ncbi:MAG TPA: DHA2 family efflux MFS transporter permease subunit [Jatrophihabitantaceae bacterium]
MPTNHVRWTPSQRWTLTLAAIAALMITLDALVVSTALNTIRTDLGASLESLEWTVNAYGLTYAVLMMTGSALGDRLGRRRVLVVGLAAFTSASAACALAPSIGWLIAARAVQGVGGALVMPVAVALVSTAFAPEQRARAMGIFVALLGLGVVGGPVVGGAVAEALSWQWIFWLNVPIGVVLIPLVLARIAETPRSTARLDIGGVLLVTGGAFGVVWALVRGNGSGWGSAEVVTTLAGGIALTIAFVRWELRTAAPMLPMRLFRERTFAVSNAIGFLLFASNYGSVFLIAQYLQANRGYSPLGAGLRMLPWTVTILAVAPLAGTLAARFGLRRLVAAGLALQAVGVGLVAVLADAGAVYPVLVAPLVLAGSGISVAMPSSQNAVVSAVPPNAIGQASGTYNTLRQLGGAFGVAVVVAVFSAAGSYAGPREFGDGFVVALGVAAAIAAVGAGVALGLPGRRRIAAEPSPVDVPDLVAADV